MNALGGIPATIDPTVICAAKTLAGSMLDLLTDPATLSDAQREFQSRLEGNADRDPLLPPDHEAPVDLPWPEYVTTPRGTHWSNPFDAEPAE